MDVTTLGHARRAFFQLQNRISLALNEQIRPPRAKRITVARYDETDKGTDGLSDQVNSAFVALDSESNDSPLVPELCFGDGYIAVRFFGSLTLGQQVALMKKHPVNAESWHDKFRKPVEAHVASCESWFDAQGSEGLTLECSVTSGGEDVLRVLADTQQVMFVDDITGTQGFKWAKTKTQEAVKEIIGKGLAEREPGKSRGAKVSKDGLAWLQKNKPNAA